MSDFELYGTEADKVKGAAAERKAKEAADEHDGTNVTVEIKELLSYIERVERLTDEKQAIAEDIKSVKAEAKGRGFDMTAFNEMLKLRKMDATDRAEREAMRGLYGEALGVFG